MYKLLFRLLSISIILFSLSSCELHSENSDPIPGDSANIMVSDISDNGFTITWEEATNNSDLDIEYKVYIVLGNLSKNNLIDKDNLQDSGNSLLSYTSNNLLANSVYTYCVTVSHEDSNEIFYDVKTVTTNKILSSKYSITYDLNTGSGTIPEDYKHYYEGDEVTLAKDTGFTNIDAIYGGWSTSANGDVLTDNYIVEDFDVTFFAIWDYIDKYTITYDINGGEGITPVDDSQYIEGDIVTLNSGEDIEKNLNSFSGWSLTSDGELVSNPYTVGTEDVLLYAIWTTLPTYNISYDPDGGIGTTPTDLNHYIEDSSVTLNDASTISKAGYVFAGWSLVSSGVEVSNPYTVGTSDVTFYALWLDTYHVSVGGDDSNNGSQISPFASIQRGINEAETNNIEKVHISAGNYNITSTINMADNVDIIGGFNPVDWSENRLIYDSRIILSGASVAVEALNIADVTRISGISITMLGTGSDQKCISIVQSPNVSVDGCYIYQNGSIGDQYGIYVEDETYADFYQNKIVIDTGAENAYGIMFYMVRGIADVYNNVIDVNFISTGNDNFGIGINAAIPTLSLTVRNNTIRFGDSVAGISAAVGHNSLSGNGGAIKLKIDNNIFFTDPAPSVNRIGVYSYVTDTTIESFKNNNIFNVDSFYRNTTGDNFISIPVLETSLGAVAEQNIILEMVVASYFTDPANRDYSLSGTAPIPITKGGVQGSSVPWNFYTDITGELRTTSISPTWSRGAYEKN